MSRVQDFVPALADALGLRPADVEVQPTREVGALLLPDILKFRLSSPRGAFDVYLVEENAECSRYLNYTGSLSGFYNARYLFEFVKHKKLDVPIGHYKCFLRSSVDETRFFVALLLDNPPRNCHVKHTLSLEDVLSAAEALSRLHSAAPNEKAQSIVNRDNFVLVQGFQSVFLKQQINHYVADLLNKYPQVFPDSERTLAMSFRSLEDAFRQSSALSSAFCHGNLLPGSLEFAEDGSLLRIKNWEHVHFGDPVEDLTYLMATGLEPDERRRSYMTVLRRYYYARVDMNKLPFKLSDLKAGYWRFLKYCVFLNLFALSQQIYDPASTDSLKLAQVTRWEALLQDAHRRHSGDCADDNEDPLVPHD